MARRDAAKAGLSAMEATGQTQLSRTDPDARLLTKNGQTVAGYNAQIAVDEKHRLIVASDVVNDGNDTGQLHTLALAAKQALEVQTLQAVADCGYFNGETLKACEEDAIETFVAEPQRRRTKAGGRFGLDQYRYDAASDTYRCPNGATLKPMASRKTDAAGKRRIPYAILRTACRACPVRTRCLAASAQRRIIERWEHEAVVERHRARMTKAVTADMMRRRKASAEHPLGTLKCRAGYTHFLVRGFEKVRGEWSQMVLCYNFTRVLNLIGLKRFTAWLAQHNPCQAHRLPATSQRTPITLRAMLQALLPIRNACTIRTCSI